VNSVAQKKKGDTLGDRGKPCCCRENPEAIEQGGRIDERRSLEGAERLQKEEEGMNSDFGVTRTQTCK